MDVLFEEIANEVIVNQTTGALQFRIPKYYVYEFRKYSLYGAWIQYKYDKK